MATLYGFLLGSLVVLWPWQVPVSAMTDRQGDSRTIQSLPVTPIEYGEIVGDPMLLLCVLSFVMGGIFVRLLSSRAPVKP
jgi:putative membrane protein